jgi:hypothetical protein
MRQAPASRSMVLEAMPSGQLANTLFANLGHLRAPQVT